MSVLLSSGMPDYFTRATAALMKEHGPGAWREATARYHAFGSAGDTGNAALWLRIATAICHAEHAPLGG